MDAAGLLSHRKFLVEAPPSLHQVADGVVKTDAGLTVAVDQTRDEPGTPAGSRVGRSIRSRPPGPAEAAGPGCFDPGNGPVHAAQDGRMQPTTAKKKLLEPVMTLSEAEAGEALRPLDARQDETEGRVGQPVEGARGRVRRFDAAPLRSPSAPPATYPGEARRGLLGRASRVGSSPGRGDDPRRSDRLPQRGPRRPRDHHDPGARAARRHQRDQQQGGAGSDEGHPTPDRSVHTLHGPVIGIGRKTSKSEGQMERRPRRPKTCPRRAQDQTVAPTARQPGWRASRASTRLRRTPCA